MRVVENKRIIKFLVGLIKNLDEIRGRLGKCFQRFEGRNLGNE